MDQHFDAERLAAFADGSLSREERAAAEAHAADCPRCLQLLAAMVRTEQATATAGHAPWRIPTVLRWSVPLLAGATALALWINLREQPAVEPPQPSVESSDAAAPAKAEPRPEQPAAREDEKALKFAEPERRIAGGVPQAKVPADQISRMDPERRAEPATPEVKSAPLSDRQLGQLPAPAPPTIPVAAPADAPIAGAKKLPGVAGEALQDSARFRAQERVAETVAATRNAPPAPIDVVSPDGLGSWRVAGKTIFRSNDGGKTWATERVPVQGEIAAGASPAPLVAWFVGRGGYILLTTGTNQWRRVIFPEPVDLASINAKNESEAEVTTADGRVFTTADGGRTWTRR